MEGAWHGESLPIIGAYQSDTSSTHENNEDASEGTTEIAGANNVIPMIHIKDLAAIIVQLVIIKNFEDKYILAVDQSNNTLAEIVKVI